MLGMPAVAIPIGEGRQPVFPAAVSGSITHTRHYCAAASIEKGVVWSIGIDAEEDQPVEDAVARRIMCPDERAALANHAGLGNVELLAFGLKEAFYKAAFPVCQRYIRFDEVAVRISERGCRIELVSAALVEALTDLEVVARFCFANLRVHCAVALVCRVRQPAGARNPGGAAPAS